VFVPPPFTWTGFYVGVNAGGIWPSGSRNINFINPTTLSFLALSEPGGLGSQSAGFIGGGQAGYNWQTGAFVLGVETDFQGTTLSKETNFVSPGFIGAGVPANLVGDTLGVHLKSRLDWLGTTRGRVGYVVTPDNRLMIYATGGVAYAGATGDFNIFDATRGLALSGSPSKTRVGWTIGGGVEYALTNNWTIRGEYLYADLGKSNFTTPIATIAPFTGFGATGRINYNASIFRGAVNYKF
jgi:outer membrane immunogenic protein